MRSFFMVGLDDGLVRQRRHPTYLKALKAADKEARYYRSRMVFILEAIASLSISDSRGRVYEVLDRQPHESEEERTGGTG